MFLEGLFFGLYSTCLELLVGRSSLLRVVLTRSKPILTCHGMVPVVLFMYRRTLNNILLCKSVKEELQVHFRYKLGQALLQSCAALMY